MGESIGNLVCIFGKWYRKRDRTPDVSEMFFVSFEDAKQFVDTHEYELIGYYDVGTFNGQLARGTLLDIPIGKYKEGFGMTY